VKGALRPSNAKSYIWTRKAQKKGEIKSRITGKQREEKQEGK